jgi:8-oxo-dGTP diphosphatase
MNTTLCYIEQDGRYLMLLRNKKKVDINKNKWIGVGGKFEAAESPEECLLREVKEETGLTLLDYRLRGVVTFVSDEWGYEYMFLYTADRFEGTLTECREGELRWIPKEQVPSLNVWEGDRAFLTLLAEESPFFSMKLRYRGDELVDKQIKVYG